MADRIQVYSNDLISLIESDGSKIPISIVIECDGSRLYVSVSCDKETDTTFQITYSGLTKTWDDSYVTIAFDYSYKYTKRLNLSGSFDYTGTQVTSIPLTWTTEYPYAAPDAPTEITIPTEIMSGSRFTVKWSAVTGAENYVLRRYVTTDDTDSDTWETVTTTTARSYIDTALDGWKKVRYNVRAMQYGKYSPYKYTSTVAITPVAVTPDAPSAISFTSVQAGRECVVTWAESSNAVSYNLQRSVDEASYTDIYSGSDTSYTDIIGSAWNSVQYRVCAVSSTGNLSDYLVSAFAEISHISTDLLTAVRNHTEQDIKLVFGDNEIIGKSKISLSSGVVITDILNGDTDYVFGKCPCRQLETTLINTDGEFNGFDFAREFALKIGVKVNGEFVYSDIGIFKGERPEKVRGKLIEFTAYDRMQSLETSASEFIEELQFPTTLSDIFEGLCVFCGISHVGTSLLNGDKEFAFNPFSSSDYTCREVLGWIAEANGNYARFNGIGKLELIDFNFKPHTILKSDRFDLSESDFETPQLSCLECYNSYGDQLVTVGSGNNTYVISDNPFLYIENDTEIESLKPYIERIFNKISDFPAYNPIYIRCEWYPDIRSGDIISVVDDYGETKTLPIFAQTIYWNSFGKVEYESTGGTSREIATIEQRELEEIKKKMLRGTDLSTAVESFLSTQKGIASIKSAVDGKYVEISDGSTITSTATIEQLIRSTEDNIESKISLTAGIGKGTIGSNVQAILTLFANKDSSSIGLSANAINLTATPVPETETVYPATLLPQNNKTDDGVTVYKFESRSNGEFISTNYDTTNSFAYGIISLTFDEETVISLQTSFDGDTTEDVGLVSELDTALNLDTSIDNTNVFYSTESGSSLLQGAMTVPKGTHFFVVKFVRGSSKILGYEATDYYFSVTVSAQRQVMGRNTTLKLSSKNITLSTANLDISGTVTFSDLSTPGKTIISGANVTTDTLKVKSIYFNSDDDVKILESKIKEKYETIDFGLMNEIKGSSATQQMNLYAREFNFIYSGESSGSRDGLLIDMADMSFTPLRNARWNLGSESYAFNRIYCNRLYFADGTYINTAP